MKTIKRTKNSLNHYLNNNNIRAATLATLALLTVPNVSIAADNLLDQIIERNVLRVGTTGDYKPFSYRKNSEGKFAGFDIEMAQRLADKLGVKIELVPTTWPNLMNDLREQKFDLAMSGVSVTLERQKVAFYSAPYLRDGKTPITLCKNKDRFQTLAQIDQAGVTAIVNPGGTNQKFANENLKRATIKVHPDNVTIFEQIIEGKADLMMTDAVETKLQAKIHPELCALHPDKPFDFSEKAYLMPRDMVFKQFVDQWLRQEIESGQFNKTFDKWLDFPWQAAYK
ncbi:transporter substrate-binding domain-containing protein [Aeromonas cavernicola]|uniref:Arogenate dehydratase n=1 Tax=Aeromonas cavernicola TaxID=1006623 RepID=A0A2H9U6A4_9GAMM|nr:transporter substrate-binding domain-containing protein [Aeromonas cavernicola]PJG59541.1 arogenate dehydratase [Aeromonas cavernicola]